MNIKLTDDKPVVYRPYRMSFFEKEQVRNIVRELKEADIIEETDSPFASPVILVKKLSGEVTFPLGICVGYRALNKKTVKQHYPLPLIDNQLDRLRGQPGTNVDGRAM
ncbi:Retrovirus-related Pol polyprotein from transposon 412-like Protein [Tribolium castaneum]|uniref:Retrovirus-related Pol polyprotein from transposon 412-like Protein n=1 Tax=Tribolium castaneum TaxID=7070 RepID=D7EIG5_TRICA|nr:Retrovirus-related Pol polyprotein from transposon 412-like Protein [Tribolium castaneum]